MIFAFATEYSHLEKEMSIVIGRGNKKVKILVNINSP